jgi:hypothetical protein
MASKVKNLIYVFLYLTTLSVLSKQTEPEEIKKTSIFFDNNINHNILYIYAPGMMATENMMGRYCPEFTAQTGEKIMWNNGGHVIGQPHSAVVFPEINLRRSKSFSLNPITN